MKKLICFLLVIASVLTFTACGKTTDRLSKDGVFYFGSEEGAKVLDANPNPLDPQTVYSKFPVNEKMLYGNFEMEQLEKGKDDFLANADFAEISYAYIGTYGTAEENKLTKTLTTLPIRLTLGTPYDYNASRMGNAHEWATLGLMNDQGAIYYIFCSYTVSGNTISFTPLEAFQAELNEKNQPTRYFYTIGTKTLDYTFSMNGTSLTLTRDGKSVTLKDEDFANNGNSMIDFNGYASTGSPRIDGLDYILSSLSKSGATLYMRDTEDQLFSHTLNNGCIRMTEDGKLSIYWTEKDAEGNVTEHLKHFIFYPGTNRAFTLSDGEKVYYYTDNYTTRNAVSLGVGMTEDELKKLNGLSEDELEKIAQKKEGLLTALSTAYEEAGLKVTIDKTTGEVSLDTTVLFDVNESQISQEGQAFLQKFAQIYTSIVYSTEYDGFISRILVEGHTDTSGSYELNKELSQKRADSVKAYCTSAECGIDAAYAEQFAGDLEAVGHAYDYPVYDTDGNVDMDASRRVSFRFIIQVD